MWRRLTRNFQRGGHGGGGVVGGVSSLSPSSQRLLGLLLLLLVHCNYYSAMRTLRQRPSSLFVRAWNLPHGHHHHHHHQQQQQQQQQRRMIRSHQPQPGSSQINTYSYRFNDQEEVTSPRRAAAAAVDTRYLPPPPNVTRVDSPAFVVLHYFRRPVKNTDHNNNNNNNNNNNHHNDDHNDPDTTEESEERQRIMERMKERQQFQNKRRYVKPPVPSTEPPKFTIRRSFVGHPSFRYLTTTSRTNDQNNNIPPEQQQVVDAVVMERTMGETQRVYQELKSVADQIRQQDEIYYNQQQQQSPSSISSATVTTGGGSSSSSTYIQLQPHPQPISDAEYDALVALEEQLCRQYPDVYERIQQEELNNNNNALVFFRYDGRIGIAPPLTTTESPTVPLDDPRDIHNVVDDGDDDEMELGADDGMTIAKMKENDVELAAAAAAQSSSRTTPTTTTKRFHLRPMLSLDNVHDTTQLWQWLRRIRTQLLRAHTVDRINLEDTVGEDDDDVVESAPPVSFTIITEPKLDGLSLNLRYELVVVRNTFHNDDDDDDDATMTTTTRAFYQLQYASTRGDGTKGTDVTAAVREGMVSSSSSSSSSGHHHNAIPETFPVPSSIATSTIYHFWPPTLEVRGEIVLPQSIFQQMQQQQEEVGLEHETTTTNQMTIPLFSNARNAASGILLRKESSVVGANQSNSHTNDLRSKLRFYAYDIVVDNPDRLATMMPIGGSIRELLRIFGFTVPQPCVSTTLTVHPTRPPKTSKADDDDNKTNGDDGSIDLSEWTESHISNMLQYYDELREYRETMNRNQDASKSEKSGRGKVSKASQYEWGDYDMDGCVHKVLDESVRVLLGSSNRAPRWAVAHKFPPTVAITELINIDIQVGRTGALTPVAILKPVDIDGVTIQRATMHNFNHMQQILGHPNRVINGTKVLVRRAGEVIPQVMSRVFPMTEAELLLLELDPTKSISIQLPTHCPACGSIAVGDNKDNDPVATTSSTKGTVLRCSGPSILCPPRTVAALQHAYSRDAFDVTGLSEARIDQLIDAGFLQVPSDLFELAKDEAKLAEIAKLPGWGKKSVQNIATIANKISTDGVTLSRFIYSLGIRGSGVHSSNLIASVYGNIDAFLSDLKEAADEAQNEVSTDETLTGFARLQEDNDSTKGIGPTLIAALHDFAKEPLLVDATRRLAECVKVHNSESLARSSGSDNTNTKERPLSGLSVVFTGSIADLSRTDAQKIAKELGAKSTPASVSKSTGLVVSGEAGGKKLIQALKLGVRVMNAEEFLSMVDEYRQNK